MAHKRKDTYTPVVSSVRWNKHLKPIGKRMQNQRERRAAKKNIDRDTENS